MHNSDVSTSISLRVPGRGLSNDIRRQLLARFHRSDFTQRAFCEQAGIPLSTLRWWLVQGNGLSGSNRLMSREAAMSLSMLKSSGGSSDDKLRDLLLFDGGREPQLTISMTQDGDELGQFLRALESAEAALGFEDPDGDPPQDRKR